MKHGPENPRPDERPSFGLERLEARALLSLAISPLAAPMPAEPMVALDAGDPVSLLSDPTDAQASLALDTLVFGNSASESAHALSTASTQVISGALGQSARQAMPLNPLAVNGGSLTFTVAVDPVQRNYFSIKLWGGDDTDMGKGRLYLYVPVNGTNYQVGYRHEGDYAPLSVTASKPPLPGRFFYSATLLPLTGPAGTRGKTSITLTIQSTGELYGLGSGGPPSGNYQFNMDTPSRGIYRAYTHTQPMLDVSTETQGAAPATTTRSAPSESGVLGPSGTYTNGVNSWVNGRLGAAITNFTTSAVAILAQSYLTPEVAAGYENASVISKVIAVIDGFTADWYTNPGNVSDSDNYGAAGGNEVWGGRFGALGWAIHLLEEVPAFQSALDVTVNYGTVGGDKTRRAAWGDMLQASRDTGRFSRDNRYLTNQSLIADENIYKANAGLLALGDPDAFSESSGQRYLKESIGILPWLGSDLPGGGSSLKYGSNYYQVTGKGLSREWSYAGGYSEMQIYAANFYRWTGNVEFRTQAIKMAKAIAYLRRPAIEMSGGSNYRAMERIGLLAWRGVREADGYFANEIAYGDQGPWSSGMTVAGTTLDPHAVGYAKQMLADGQYLSQLVADSRYYTNLSLDSRWALNAWADYNAVKSAADSGIRLPMSDGQADFAFADEQAGIAVLKRGSERLWIEPYWQAKTGTGINGIGRFHYSTATYDQYGTFETTPQFDFSGSYFVRPNYVDMTEQTRYAPPDNPSQAYAGERLPIGNALDAHDHAPHSGKVGFYGFRFGEYLFGINSSLDASYALKTPAGFTSATDLITGTSKSGTITVAPGSSVVLLLDSATDVAPVPNAPLWLNAIGSPAQISLEWSAASGATSYNVKRSVTSHGPYATIASNVSGTSFIDTNVTRGATYYYVVTGANENGESYNSGEFAASASLPGPWNSLDIGSPLLAGSAGYLPDGTFRIAAGGSNFGGTSDSFHFAYVPITGSATVIAHVAMLNTAGADRAGIMMRESLAADAKMAAILFEDSGNLRLARRTTTGGSGATSGSLNSTYWAPGWIKLVRSGNTFSAYHSADGVSWGSAFSSQTFAMISTIYVGLAATSRSDSQTIAANFDHVQVMPVQTVSGEYPYLAAPNRVQFTFTADVSASLQPSDLQLVKLDGGTAPAVQSVSFDVLTNTATFVLSPGLPPNGNYRATLPAGAVSDALGNPLPSSASFEFFVLAGDANRDRAVDITDLGILATNWQGAGKSFSEGDFNYDGTVDITDLGMLATNWQHSIPAPAAPAAALVARRIPRAIEQIET